MSGASKTTPPTLRADQQFTLEESIKKWLNTEPTLTPVSALPSMLLHSSSIWRNVGRSQAISGPGPGRL